MSLLESAILSVFVIDWILGMLSIIDTRTFHRLLVASGVDLIDRDTHVILRKSRSFIVFAEIMLYTSSLFIYFYLIYRTNAFNIFTLLALSILTILFIDNGSPKEPHLTEAKYQLYMRYISVCFIVGLMYALIH